MFVCFSVIVTVIASSAHIRIIFYSIHGILAKVRNKYGLWIIYIFENISKTFGKHYTFIGIITIDNV